jgi:hypothetical protein
MGEINCIFRSLKLKKKIGENPLGASINVLEGVRGIFFETCTRVGPSQNGGHLIYRWL